MVSLHRRSSQPKNRGRMLLSLLLYFGATQKPFIHFDDYKIYKPGLLAVAEDGHLCLVVPWTHRVLFFNSEGQLLQHYQRDNDAPDGFRNVATVGYDPIRKHFTIYDVGRKISYWSTQGHFVKAVFQAPLLQKPQVRGDQVFYVTQDNGELGSTPSVDVASANFSAAKTLLQQAPLAERNGYPHQTQPGPPIKMPWHYQYLLAAGRRILAACYNGQSEMVMIDSDTLKVVNRVRFKIPSVPVEDGYFKETLKTEARLQEVAPHRLQIPKMQAYHPSPSQILVDLNDQIFVYSHHFKGFLRKEYNSKGRLIGDMITPGVPACVGIDYHYYYVKGHGIFRVRHVGRTAR